jgi:hypothetical protein
MKQEAFGFCNIRRVCNGWVLDSNAPMGMRGDEYVFRSPDELADFIRDNFKLPKQEASK